MKGVWIINMIYDIQQEILRLKKERDICILAHSYQSREIIEIADFIGDSYQLSVRAKDAKQGTVIMCGVRFMAETVKLLSPDKTVILLNNQTQQNMYSAAFVRYYRSSRGTESARACAPSGEG